MTEEATGTTGTAEEAKPATGTAPQPIYTQADVDNLLSKKEAGIVKRVTAELTTKMAEEKAKSEMTELERVKTEYGTARSELDQLRRENRLLARRSEVDRLTAGKAPALYVKEAINATADDSEIDAQAIAAKAIELAKADGWNADAPAKGVVGPTKGAPRETGGPFDGKSKEQVQAELRQLARTNPREGKRMALEYDAHLRAKASGG